MNSIFCAVIVSLLFAAVNGHTCPNSLGTLYRTFHARSDNHFYTTSKPEMLNAVRALGFVQEGSPGKVSLTAQSCFCAPTLIAVHRLYRSRSGKDDHFYTASQAEVDSAVKLGYKYEAVAFYCSNHFNYCGASYPLHRFLRLQEHFYTNNHAEGAGLQYEGILCYIWR